MDARMIWTFCCLLCVTLFVEGPRHEVSQFPRVAVAHKGEGGLCYQFVNSEGSWPSARADCHHKGGYLVEISDQATQDFLVSSLRSLPWHRHGVWIGFTDQDREGTWVWDTGNPVKYTNWAPGQISGWFGEFTPNFMEDCAQIRMNDGGRWHDYPCNMKFLGYKYSHICQFGMVTSPNATTPPPPPTTPTTRTFSLTTDTTTTTTTPTTSTTTTSTTISAESTPTTSSNTTKNNTNSTNTNITNNNTINNKTTTNANTKTTTTTITTTTTPTTTTTTFTTTTTTPTTMITKNSTTTTIPTQTTRELTTPTTTKTTTIMDTRAPSTTMKTVSSTPPSTTTTMSSTSTKQAGRGISAITTATSPPAARTAVPVKTPATEGPAIPSSTLAFAKITSHEGSSELGAGAIAGMAVGSLVFIIIIAVIVKVVCGHRYTLPEHQTLDNDVTFENQTYCTAVHLPAHLHAAVVCSQDYPESKT